MGAAILAHRVGLNAFSRNTNGPTTAAGSLALAGSASGTVATTDVPSSPMARYRADSLGLANGAAVASWNDGSGNGYTLSQATAGNRPTYISASAPLNSQPAVQMAVGKSLASNAPTGDPQQSIAAVITTGTSVSGGTIRGASSANGLQFRLNAGKLNLVNQNQTDLGSSTTTLAASTSYLVAATYNASTGAGAFYVNGAAAGTFTNAVTLSTGTTVVGQNGAGNNEDFTGVIGEVIAYSRILTGTELTQLNTYYQGRYVPASYSFPYTDTFTGTDGAAWSSNWTTQSGSSFAISGNQGQITSGSGTYANVSTILSAATAAATGDAVVTLAPNNPGSESYFLLGLCSDGVGAYGSSNIYAAETNPSNGSISLFQVVGGTRTSIGTAYTPNSAITGPIKIRVQVIAGGILRARYWLASGSEGTSWMTSGSVTGSLSGKPSIGWSNGNGNGVLTAKVDDYTYSAAPVAPSLVRQNTAYDTATSGTTHAITLPSVGASHSLVLSIATFDTNASSTVTDSASNTWTKVVEIAAGASGAGTVGTVSLWYCKTPAAQAGTLTITLTNAGTGTLSAMNVSEWSKVLTTRNTSTANSGSGTVTSQTATVTSVANDLVLAAQSRYDNVNQTPTSPAVALTFVAASSVSDASAYVVASGTSTTIGWATGSAQQTTTVIASFSN